MKTRTKVLIGLAIWAAIIAAVLFDIGPKVDPAIASAPAPAADPPPDSEKIKAALAKCGVVLSSVMNDFEREVCEREYRRRQDACSDETLEKDRRAFRSVVQEKLDAIEKERTIMTGGHDVANILAKREFLETRMARLERSAKTEPSDCLQRRDPPPAHARDMTTLILTMGMWAATAGKLESTDNRAAYKADVDRLFNETRYHFQMVEHAIGVIKTEPKKPASLK